MSSTNGAINSKKENTQQTRGTEKTIHIGVFFDGTGNNKFQSMLGKLFRDKQAIADTPAARHPDGTPMTIGEVRAKKRDYWAQKGVFTKSQLDVLFFGYENMQEGQNVYLVEDSQHLADLVAQDNPDDEVKKVKSQMMTIMQGKIEYKLTPDQVGMSDDVWKKYKKANEGGDVQGSTYTNVAVLEAVYKTDDDYYPIYVEGAGTNMEDGEMNLWSGGTGRGDSIGLFFDSVGVFDKLQKGVNAVARIAQKYVEDTSVTNLTIKMSTYGFSRGATEARMFAFVYSYDKNDDGVVKMLNKIGRSSFLNNDKIKKELNFVGVFDTVASVTNFDTQSLHLYGVDKAEKVLHLCAMDEYRDHFPLTDISSAFSNGLELFLPGCHTDVGGGVDLGVDRWRQIDNYKTLTLDTCYINKWNRNNSSDYVVPSVDVLKEMGWLLPGSPSTSAMPKNMTEEQCCEAYGAIYSTGLCSVSLRKYVRPGYSNIPLLLMRKYAAPVGVLKTIPCSYKLSADLLKKLFVSWKDQAEGTGQKFVTLSNEQYKLLRSLYLHYSGNDEVSTNGAVNNVEHERIELNKKLITRRIFYGKNQKETSYYLSHLN